MFYLLRGNRSQPKGTKATEESIPLIRLLFGEIYSQEGSPKRGKSNWFIDGVTASVWKKSGAGGSYTHFDT